MPHDIDGILVQWGDRLFYPGNRAVGSRTPKLSAIATRRRAAAIRARLTATVGRRLPQVMVKVTGGGRGMRAIAAHFRYISKNGRLDIEDERGQVSRGEGALHELADDWRFGGTLIDDVGYRREAFNIMLSMPRGTDPLSVHWAAREFARIELADHKLVMVLHDHQANPHVHISVRAESKHGKRLNPRKADLRRWRETFAERLQARGIECQATRPALEDRQAVRFHTPLWRIKAGEAGRLRGRMPDYAGPQADLSRPEAVAAWRAVTHALASSPDVADRMLAGSMARHVDGVPRSVVPGRAPAQPLPEPHR